MICIIVLAGGLEDGPKADTQYMVLFNNILHRMRFSKFLKIVSGEFDEEVSSFSFGLMFHQVFEARSKLCY